MRRPVILGLIPLLVSSSIAVAWVAPPVVGPPKDTPRTVELRKLAFDRRPSAVLKAWAPRVPEVVKPNAPKATPFAKEMEVFQRQVTLGQWPAVKTYLAGLTPEEGKAGYEQMLTSLRSGPRMAMPGQPGGGGPAGGDPGMAMEMMAMGMMGPGMPQPGPAMAYAERNHFSPDDLVGLAAAAPKGLDKEAVAALSAILVQCHAAGNVIEAIVSRFEKETARPGASFTRRQAAQMLVGGNHAAEAERFLPALPEARVGKDLEALNLLAQVFVDRHAKEKKLAFLEQAWGATQAALEIAPTDAQRPGQEEALTRAVELAPRLKKELGQVWLGQSFTAKPERGMAILATIGGLSSQGLQMNAHSPERRLQLLELQKTAVEALLAVAPGRAKEWQSTLSLLAGNWIKEADFSYQFAPDAAAKLRRDRYGNFFFWDEMAMNRPQNPNQPKAIELADALFVRPNDAWVAAISGDLRPKLSITLCQLHLKAEEDKLAFPHIERLAAAHPKQARELANEFLRVWTRNHDLNSKKERTNPYMYMYGFESRSDGIPLTRSKQERNLVDLAEWVGRLKRLPIGEGDEELLARAFMTCHSSAEVYRSEAIEKVFGPMGGLKPKTLAGLAQQMRENLAGIWRQPGEQTAKKTNRKTKDIQLEVRRGYGVARATVEDALKKFPDDWALVLARAALMHDQASFEYELGKSTLFAQGRLEAYAQFAKAAKLYAAQVKDLTEEDQSTRVFEQWFYASLGACDLGQVTEEKVPDARQPGLVRDALLALPGETAEKHREKFANLLFTRMQAVKPQIKYRYLKGGFEIIGDHKAAAEAKKVFEYYRDLVEEIKLVTKIDGSSSVGHKKPFGVFVMLEHTREIERESGGFGRYLQNQNTSTTFSWNYGRPTTDYRDRFQAAATEALKEHFEVLSVTFETDKVHSRATAQYGWRVTPYAYLLLKPRGPRVDKLPPLRIDLDFLDTSGYAVLPIESPAVALDARSEDGDPRPYEKLEITQTLDERQVKEGKLLLEVKASASGLVPDLDSLLKIAPEGFEVVKTDDQGVSVSKFQPEGDDIAVSSERNWIVTLAARDGIKPERFRFGEAADGSAKLEYQRYDDADMAKVSAELALGGQYGRRSMAWVWWTVGGAVLMLVLTAVLVWRLSRPRALGGDKWQLPQPLTPFSGIRLLEQIRTEGGLSKEHQAELTQSIHHLERSYFAGESNGDGRADLKAVTENWIRRAR